MSEYLTRIEPYEGRIDEVHTVGGLHPDWDVEYYELFSASKKSFPHIHIKSLSAVEVKHIAEMSGLPTRELLKRLQSAGLDSLPGGGAEILDDAVETLSVLVRNPVRSILPYTVMPIQLVCPRIVPCYLVRLRPFDSA